MFEALTIDENFPILAHQYGNACEAVWNHGYSSVKNLILKCGIQDILYENPNGAVRKHCSQSVGTLLSKVETLMPCLETLVYSVEILVVQCMARCTE